MKVICLISVNAETQEFNNWAWKCLALASLWIYYPCVGHTVAYISCMISLHGLVLPNFDTVTCIDMALLSFNSFLARFAPVFSSRSSLLAILIMSWSNVYKFILSVALPGVLGWIFEAGLLREHSHGRDHLDQTHQMMLLFFFFLNLISLFFQVHV